jgi:hypothetical protein
MKTFTIKPHVSGDINTFKVIGDGAAQTPYESDEITNHLKHLILGNPIKEHQPYLAEIDLTQVKKGKKVYSEVISDHEDPDGNIAIDVYEKDAEDGSCICLVSPDGKVFLGQHAMDIKEHLSCSLVRDEIAAAQERQEERKQSLIDKLLVQIRDDMNAGQNQGDVTVLDELLKFIPCKNLMKALPEEEWKQYPLGWSE